MTDLPDRIFDEAMEALIQAEMDQIWSRECPECGQRKVFRPDCRDYICVECRAALESQS